MTHVLLAALLLACLDVDASHVAQCEHDEEEEGQYRGNTAQGRQRRKAGGRSLLQVEKKKRKAGAGVHGTAKSSGTSETRVISGLNVPLDEDGYEAVASLHSDYEMEHFVWRVIDDMGDLVTHQAGLRGFVPYCSGHKAKLGYEAMLAQISNASKTPGSWVQEKSSIPQAASLQQLSEAPLDEWTYRAFVERGSDFEMEAFVRRVVASMGFQVTDDAGLHGFVPYYSGNKDSQSLLSMREDLERAAACGGGGGGAGGATEAAKSSCWLGGGLGRNAPLDEAGYAKVAAVRSGPDMEAFVRRVIASLGFAVDDEAALQEVVPYYSGEISTQSFDALRKELLGAVR